MNAASTDSLATNPSSGGTPAIEAAASVATVASTGAARPTPDRSRRSRVPASWSRMPTTRNSAALNSACATSIATPASAAFAVPAPNSTASRPSWLTVPYASSSFRSVCRSAAQPPSSSVTSPATTVTGRHGPAAASAGPSSPMRKMPAFTIAAACRYALTGVGAAIATGSHALNGNTADFASAPARTSSTASARYPPPGSGADATDDQR